MVVIGVVCVIVVVAIVLGTKYGTYARKGKPSGSKPSGSKPSGSTKYDTNPSTCDIDRTDIPSVYVQIPSDGSELPSFKLRDGNAQTWIDKQATSDIGSKTNMVLTNMYKSVQGSIDIMNKLINQRSGSVSTNYADVAPCSTHIPTTFACDGNLCTYQSVEPWNVSRAAVAVLMSPTATYTSSST